MTAARLWGDDGGLRVAGVDRTASCVGRPRAICGGPSAISGLTGGSARSAGTARFAVLPGFYAPSIIERCHEDRSVPMRFTARLGHQTGADGALTILGDRPGVTRAGVERFRCGPDNLGQDFVDEYVVFTTSGIDWRASPAGTGSPRSRRDDRADLRTRPRRPDPGLTGLDAHPGTAVGWRSSPVAATPQHDDVRLQLRMGALPAGWAARFSMCSIRCRSWLVQLNEF